jgi:quinohemoprotein ethanol dehydrogenase
MDMKGRGILSLKATAFLVVVTVAAGSSANSQRAIKPGNVYEARVLAEASTGRNWLVNGGNFGSQHFSPLKQITDKNIGNLGLAWYVDIDSPMGMASEPIIVDGTIYVRWRRRLGHDYL